MKNIQYYDIFVNESIKHLLKPKSKEDILNKIDKMDKYDKMDIGCKYDILWLVKQSLDEGIDPSMNLNYAIRISCENGSEEVVKFLLNDERVDPSVMNNGCIWTAADNGYLNVVNILLKDKRVDPSDDNNVTLWAAYERYLDRDHNDNNYAKIVRLLLKDKRVRKKLTNNEYKNLWNSINLNESIKHLLKPRSEEDIKKLLDGKSPEELINKSYLSKSNWLLIYALKKGAKLNNIKYANIYTSKQGLHDRIYNIFINACEENDIELVKILLNDEGFDPSIGTHSASFFIKRLSAPLVFAYKKGNYEIVKLLFKDKRIRNILNDKEIMFLEEKMPELFEQNESISHLLKPKSKEQIISRLSDMYPYEKLSTIIRYDISKYFKFEEIIDLFEKCNIDKKREITLNFLSKYHYTKKWNDKIMRFFHVFDMTDLELLSFFKEVIIFDIKKINKNKINESIRHLLKPKPEDEIKKSFKNMSIKDKNKIMMDFIRQEDLNMMLFMLNNGLEITSHMINAATTCHNLSALSLLRYIREKRIERTLESKTFYPYRFKTRQEFEDEFGDDWRYLHDSSFPTSMDYLFGKPYPFVVDMDFGYLPNLRDDNGHWSIEPYMLTKNEPIVPSYTPKERPKRLLESNHSKYEKVSIIVNNDEESIRVQDICFKYNYKWGGSINKHMYFTYPFVIFCNLTNYELTFTSGQQTEKEINNYKYPPIYYPKCFTIDSISLFESFLRYGKEPPNYNPKEKPKRLLENNIHYPYRFKTKEEFIKDYGDHEFGSSRNRIGWRYGAGLMKDGSFCTGMDYLLGQPYPYNININDYEDGIGNLNLPNIHGWTIEKFMLTRNIKEPTYEPKERPKRLLENNIEPSLILNPEQQEHIFKVGKIFKIREDAFDYSFDVCSNMKEYLGKIVKIIKIDKLKHIYQHNTDLYIRYPYNKESNLDDLIITVEKVDDINDNGQWYWYYRCFEITPTYEPKKRTERTLEKLNENFIFITDNNKLKEIDFHCLIGDFVTLKSDALQQHLKNLPFVETDNVINFIENNIGNRFEVLEVAKHVQTGNYYLELKTNDTLTSTNTLLTSVWIYLGSVISKISYYTPKSKPKRLLESKVIYPYRIKTEKEFINDYGERWRDFLDNNGPNWSSSMDYLFGEVLPFTIDKFNDKDNYYASDDRYNHWVFSWYMLTPNIPIKPTYEPKKRTERTLEKLNEDYIFINDNEKLKRINFDYLIGDSVIIRYDALDLHLNNILWSEDSQTISFIKNNIGKRFIVEEVAYCTDNHQYYLKIEVGKGLKMWIYSGAVKSIEPNYKPKRLLEEVIFNDETDFRVWCDTIEKSKEFEDLLYKWGWKWDIQDNRRIQINSKMTYLFFMDRKKFDSYSGYNHDDLTVYNYPKDLNKIFSLLNPPPSYKPKGINKRTLD